MSAGHRVDRHPSKHLLGELSRLLADPRVAQLLARPPKIDFSHEMPLTGGSTVEWGTFFLDPRLAQRFRVGTKTDVNLSAPVLWHEMVEKALRMVFGMGYARAHVFATLAERMIVEKMDLDWSAYKRVMASIVRKDEHEQPKTLPEGYDYGPLRESRGVKSLEGLRKRFA